MAARAKKPAAEERAEAAFKKVAARLTTGDVTTQGRGFGAGALKWRGKIFAMVSSKGQFVVKLPAARVVELSKEGAGRPFEPGPGRLMKEWLAITEDGVDHLALSKEALAFVQAAPAQSVSGSRRRPRK